MQMMNRGISINTYLEEGDPEGIAFTEISSWTGLCIKIPRNLFSGSKHRPELQRPGLYLLLGHDINDPGDKIAYIGEGNNLFKRISKQLRNPEKSFVETIICFCSKDENLTVSHTKYLEQKTIKLLAEFSEFRLANRVEGSVINLSRTMQAEMDTYFYNMSIILPTLGYAILTIGATTPKPVPFKRSSRTS